MCFPREQNLQNLQAPATGTSVKRKEYLDSEALALAWFGVGISQWKILTGPTITSPRKATTDKHQNRRQQFQWKQNTFKQRRQIKFKSPRECPMKTQKSKGKSNHVGWQPQRWSKMLVLVRSVLADLYAPCVQCLEKMSCMCSWAHRSSQYKHPKVCKSKPENSYSSHMPVSTNASYSIIHVCRAESCLWPSASLPRTIPKLGTSSSSDIAKGQVHQPIHRSRT